MQSKYAKAENVQEDMFMDMTVLQIVHWWHVGTLDNPANMRLFSRMARQVASSMWLITM